MFTIGATAAKMNTNSGDERSRADEFNEVTMEVWEELEAKAATETLQLAFPPAFLNGLKALGEPSSKLLHKSVLAQKHRIDRLVEEVKLLAENPNTFELASERSAPLLCVKAEDAGGSVLYGLSAPWLLQLEGIVD